MRSPDMSSHTNSLTRQAASDPQGQDAVRDYWNRESCGERYGAGEGREFYESHSRLRYALEPWIRPFAKFEEGAGLRVLEMGVGMGADYLNWRRAGARAIGVDLTPRAVGHTARRCAFEGDRAVLCVADGERLPFKNDSFDLYYSWGVAHHSADTPAVFAEAARVLKPGGVARFAIYHYPSWSAFAIWGRRALATGQLFRSVRAVVAEHLESPGTKLFTVAGGRELCRPFRRIRSIRPQLGPGDLLTQSPSERYRDPLSRAVWALYPRWLIRRLGNRWGLYLLIECEK